MTIKKLSIIVLVSGASGALFLLMAGWLRWPDLIIDYGREIYIPWRLSEGGVLYKDVFYYYGPLAQLLNTVVVHFWGVSVQVLERAAFVSSLVTAALLYAALRPLARPFTAGTGVVVFFMVFAFAEYYVTGNYNYLTPYSHELPLGSLLSLAALAIGGGYLRKPSTGKIVLIGACFGLVLLTKVEMAAAFAAGAATAGLCALWKTRRGPSGTYKAFGAFFLGMAFVLGIFVGIVSLYWGLSAAIKAVFFQYAFLFKSGMTTGAFYQHLSGLDDIWGNGKRLAGMALIWGAFFAALGSVGVLCRKTAPAEEPDLRPALAGVILAAGLWVFSTGWVLEDIFRPLPLVMAGIIVFRAWEWSRASEREAEQRALYGLVFGVFALTLLGKMILNPYVGHYGFVLSLPAVMLTCVLMMDTLPARLMPQAREREGLVFLALVLVMGVSFRFVYESARIYALKTFTVKAPAGTVITYDPSMATVGPVTAATLAFLRDRIPADATVAVMPEGVLLNVLSHHRDPWPYFEFSPALVRLLGEGRLIRDLEKARPDYCVIVDRDTTEQGAQFFGRDYAQRFYHWVREHYQLVFQAGPEPLTGRGFGMMVLRRR